MLILHMRVHKPWKNALDRCIDREATPGRPALHLHLTLAQPDFVCINDISIKLSTKL